MGRQQEVVETRQARDQNNASYFPNASTQFSDSTTGESESKSTSPNTQGNESANTRELSFNLLQPTDEVSELADAVSTSFSEGYQLPGDQTHSIPKAEQVTDAFGNILSNIATLETGDMSAEIEQYDRRNQGRASELEDVWSNTPIARLETEGLPLPKPRIRYPPSAAVPTLSTGDEEGSDGDSVSSSYRPASVFSVKSLTSSLSSVSSNKELSTATEQLVEMLVQDEKLQLQSLCVQAMDNPHIGPGRLTENLRRMLKTLGTDLLHEVNQDVEVSAERSTAAFIARSSKTVASRIQKRFAPTVVGNTFVPPTGMLADEDQRRLVNRLLQARDTQGITMNVFGHQSDDEDGSNRDQQLKHLRAVRAFVLESASFEKFRDSLCTFVLPKFSGPTDSVEATGGDASKHLEIIQHCLDEGSDHGAGRKPESHSEELANEHVVRRPTRLIIHDPPTELEERQDLELEPPNMSRSETATNRVMDQSTSYVISNLALRIASDLWGHVLSTSVESLSSNLESLLEASVLMLGHQATVTKETQRVLVIVFHHRR